MLDPYFSTWRHGTDPECFSGTYRWFKYVSTLQNWKVLKSVGLLQIYVHLMRAFWMDRPVGPIFLFFRPGTKFRWLFLLSNTFFPRLKHIFLLQNQKILNSFGLIHIYVYWVGPGSDRVGPKIGLKRPNLEGVMGLDCFVVFIYVLPNDFRHFTCNIRKKVWFDCIF